MRQYLLNRDSGDYPALAVAKVEREYEENDDLPHIPYGILWTWSDEQCWEQAFQAIVGVDTLRMEALRADTRLQNAVDDTKHAREVFLHAWRDACPQYGEEATTLPDVQKFRLAYQTLQESEQAVSAAEARLIKRAMVVEGLPDAKQRLSDIREQLMAQYGALGPQYALLVDQLAAAQVRTEQLRATSDITSDEYARNVQLVINLTAQLQRHTESQKTEQVSGQINAAMMAVLHIVERNLGDNPRALTNIVHDVKRLVEGTATEVIAA